MPAVSDVRRGAKPKREATIAAAAAKEAAAVAAAADAPVAELLRRCADVVVVDEAHIIKSQDVRCLASLSYV